MIDRDPTTLTIDDWIADLEISEAEVARGETVPLEPVLQRLRDTAARIAARRAAGPLPKAARGQ
jgi:hypothetical protein